MACAAEDDNYEPNPETIARQNDLFRRAQCLGETTDPVIPGRCVVTATLHAEGPEFLRAACHAVGTFDDFKHDNDPEGHRDFGAVEVSGKRLFFKIDMYQAGSYLRWGAERADDLATTERVLTIMFPSDW